MLDPYEHSWGLAQTPQSLLHTKTWSKQQQKLFENSGLLVTTPVTLLCALRTRREDSQGLGESK